MNKNEPSTLMFYFGFFIVGVLAFLMAILYGTYYGTPESPNEIQISQDKEELKFDYYNSLNLRFQERNCNDENVSITHWETDKTLCIGKPNSCEPSICFDKEWLGEFKEVLNE